ncbi:MAG: hypothetical protein Q7W13_08850 [Bacteroidia bacterium]|nr:hypothetical protein [Bacteroidia bacterium]
MAEINHPVLETKKIIKAAVVALIIGIVLLLTVVLPAEYGLDPTGAGKVFGFTKLYQPIEYATEITATEKQAQSPHRILKLEDGGSAPEVKKPEEANNPAPDKQFIEREDSVQVVIPAGGAIEYKINILKYGRVKYEWITNDESVFFDFHGEVKQANPAGNVYYESYAVAYSNNMIGNFLSPFEGKHGWYFKNSNDTTAVISIRLKGQYELIK